MALFAVNRAKSTLSTTADTLTIVAASTKSLRIYYAKVAGASNAPAFNEVVLQRSTGGVTPGGGITPEKLDPDSASASFTVYTTWAGGQPSLSGGPLHRFAPNANGGIDPFTAVPGGEIKVPAGGQVSLRSVEGTSPVVVNLYIEEL